jgi:hypothetical protein
MQQPEKFDIYALIELFGHSRISGRVTERNIGGASFLQVDVPDTKNNPAFTRFINPSAVYAINPITKEMAEVYAENLSVSPIKSWDVHEFIEKAKQKQLSKAASDESDTSDHFDDLEDHN